MAITDETRALDALQDHPENYNRHSDETVRLLADTIRAVGFTKPLVVNTRDVILAGHRAKRALLLLRAESRPEPSGIGLDWQVPVRVVDVPELVERKILVSDNPDPERIDFDTPALTALLTELSNAGELEGSGYGPERLEALLDDLTQPPPDLNVPDPTEKPEPQSASEAFVELYCSAADLERFRPTLETWAEADGVTVNIS